MTFLTFFLEKKNTLGERPYFIMNDGKQDNTFF